MRNILEITRNDLRLFLTQRGNLVSLLVVPVVMTLVVGIFTGGGDGSRFLQIDVIDHDRSELSRQFIDALRTANESLILCPMDNDEEDHCNLGDETSLSVQQAIIRVEDTTTLAMIEIPSDFEEAVQQFEPVEIIYRSLENLTAPGYIRQAVEAAIQRVNGAAVASRIGSGVLLELGAEGIGEGEQRLLQDALYQGAASIWAEEPVKVRYQLSERDGEQEDSNLQEAWGNPCPGWAACS